MEPLPNDGTMALVASGCESRVRAWSSSSKGTEYNLDPAAWRFDLSNAAQRQQFVDFGQSGIWIEGYGPSSAEKDVSFTLQYLDAQRGPRCQDQIVVTSVMINLANAVYRDNLIWGAASRGHAALVWRFLGPLTRPNLLNDDMFLIIEIAGPTANKTLTTITQAGVPAYGCFTNPAITYRPRLMILKAARSLVGRGFEYAAFDLL